MASYQYVYHMENVSKTYPGGKKCFENIKLNFLPGVKIGVVGVNGAGKSTFKAWQNFAAWDASTWIFHPCAQHAHDTPAKREQFRI